MRGILTMIMIGTALSCSAQIEEAFIYLKKGACFGQCPMYSISINSSGLLTYEGKRFVDHIGIFERQLTKKEFRKLKCRFKKAKIQKVNIVNEDKIMDAALTTIAFKETTIKTKLGTPERLKEAVQYLKDLSPISQTNEYSFTTISSTEEVEEVDKKALAVTEIIVQLNEGVEIDKWLKNYIGQSATLIKKLVPNRPLYLISVKIDKEDKSSFLKSMNDDPSVHTAEFNKKIDMRRQR